MGVARVTKHGRLIGWVNRWEWEPGVTTFDCATVGIPGILQDFTNESESLIDQLHQLAKLDASRQKLRRQLDADTLRRAARSKKAVNWV